LENYSQLRAKLVIGTANNQLANPQVAELLWQKGIWHIPDYIANAGGLINVADELLPGGYSLERVLGSIKKLDEILERILKQAKLQNIFPDELADASAREQLGLDRA